MLMRGRFPFKYDQFVCTACQEAVPWYLTITGFSRQDGNSIGQDRKCEQQAVEIYDGTVSRWADPRFGHRVMEGR